MSLRASTRGRRRIVVVEDDRELGEVVKDVLEAEGHHVVAFDDPCAALGRVLAGNRPDVMLLDLAMPHLSGEELLDALWDAGIHVPVVVLTGWTGPLLRRISLRVSSVLRKPVGTDELLDAIDGA